MAGLLDDSHTDALLRSVLRDAELARKGNRERCERLQARMRHLLEVRRHTQEEIESLERAITECQAASNVHLETIRECRKELEES